MWSSRRHVLLSLALVGCGFAPAYGPGGPAGELRGRILADAPESPAGYYLVRRLEDRLGRPAAPLYGLATDLSLEDVDVRVTRDEITVRYNIVGVAEYRLTDLATGAVLRTGRVESFTGYSGGSTTVASQAAETAALERLMVILADQIVADLLATAPDWLP